MHVSLLALVGAFAFRSPVVDRRSGTPSMLLDGLVRSMADADEKAYLADPVDVSAVRLPDGFGGARDVCIIFHGRGGPDRETDDLIERVRTQDAAVGLERPAAVFDWQPWFSNQASRNSFHGQEVGRRLGRLLAAEAPGLRTVHVVGTSAGAWPANELCTSYIEAAAGDKQRASVHLSLTDPFTARSDRPLADGWGGRNFGASADFAEHYLNSDDIVPSSNEPLQNCYCWDVTGAAERSSFPLPGGGSTGNPVLDAGMMLLGYHNWPMGYMARHYETALDAEGRVVLPSHENLPRGAVNFVL